MEFKIPKILYQNTWLWMGKYIAYTQKREFVWNSTWQNKHKPDERIVYKLSRPPRLSIKILNNYRSAVFVKKFMAFSYTIFYHTEE